MKSSSTTTDHQQQLRKVAILVATLDEPLAERMLADLPAREEAAVREILEHLEEINPVEQRAVLDDFRKSIATPPKPVVAPSKQPTQTLSPRTQLEGVEIDASLLARMADEDLSTPMPTPTSATEYRTSSWQMLSDADAATLVEMLSAEQPQTIAVVLSRLETAQSAELITKLTPTLQTEVLSRLADLDPADEQTLEVVASQLAQWLSAHSLRRQRMAAGRDLVQRILQDAPENQRAVLLARLGKRNPALAEQLSTESHVSQPVVRRSPRRSMATASRPVSKAAAFPVEHQPPAAIESADPLSELESLDDQGLLKALQLADRNTVMLALAGAGESLMKRIVKDLPRRKANQFRQQVRTIGPIRLSGMVAAQRELLRCGRESQETT